MVTLTRDGVILAGLYLVILGAYTAAHLPVRRLFAWYILPALFVLSLVGIMAWSGSGTHEVSLIVRGW